MESTPVVQQVQEPAGPVGAAAEQPKTIKKRNGMNQELANIQKANGFTLTKGSLSEGTATRSKTQAARLAEVDHTERRSESVVVPSTHGVNRNQRQY